MGGAQRRRPREGAPPMPAAAAITAFTASSSRTGRELSIRGRRMSEWGGASTSWSPSPDIKTPSPSTSAGGVCCYNLGGLRIPGNSSTTASSGAGLHDAPVVSPRYDMDGRDVATSCVCDEIDSPPGWFGRPRGMMPTARPEKMQPTATRRNYCNISMIPWSHPTVVITWTFFSSYLESALAGCSVAR
jgi:hypothetical protein